MVSLVAYGAYLPYWRLRRSAIGDFLGTAAGTGERTVASFDEDTTTMAVEAARQCRDALVGGSGRLLLGTSRPAYQDKTNATAVGAALGLTSGWWTSDAAASIASAATALDTASTTPGTTLLVLSDTVNGRPGGEAEAFGGDGAAAFVFRDDLPSLAHVVGRAAESIEILDHWATEGDSGSWESRFGESVLAEAARRVVATALERAGLTLEEVDHLVVAGRNERAVKTFVSNSGLAAASAAMPAVSRWGNHGVAQAGLGLAAALDVAEPGQHIVICTIGDGAQAIVLEVDEAIRRAPARVAAQSGSGNSSLSYATFLRWRRELHLEPGRRPPPDPVFAPPALRRAGWKFAFEGSICRACGAVHLPPARRCRRCGAVDQMRTRPFAETPARVAQFTIDRLAYSENPPLIPVTIDFEDGGRFRGQLTDVEADMVSAGMSVEMTFRRLATIGGVHNYFWKVRPLRTPRATQG